MTMGARVTEDSYKKGQILISSEFIRKLENAKEGSDEYKELVNFFVSTVYHEYTHFGDRDNNKGKISGSWMEIMGQKKYYADLFHGGELEFPKKGVQKHQESLTGERGNDVDLFGFSAKISCHENGTYKIERVEFKENGTGTDDKTKKKYAYTPIKFDSIFEKLKLNASQ
jgi:hypothetical protein